MRLVKQHMDDGVFTGVVGKIRKNFTFWVLLLYG